MVRVPTNTLLQPIAEYIRSKNYQFEVEITIIKIIWEINTDYILVHHMINFIFFL